MNARKIIVVADSCYSGALDRRPRTGPCRRSSPSVRRSAPRRREAVRRVHSRTMLTSGALQPVWDGVSGGNSVFAKAFLEVLDVNDSVLEGYRLFDAVEGRVIRASQQIRRAKSAAAKGGDRKRPDAPLCGDPARRPPGRRLHFRAGDSMTTSPLAAAMADHWDGEIVASSSSTSASRPSRRTSIPSGKATATSSASTARAMRGRCRSLCAG